LGYFIILLRCLPYYCYLIIFIICIIILLYRFERVSNYFNLNRNHRKCRFYL
jgi:hypothetical protein